MCETNGSFTSTAWVLTTMLCGLCAITLGSVIVAVDPYQIIFKMKVTFSDGAETFLMWKKPEVDLLLKVYLFNITNKDAFLEGKEKLKVQQVGPYVYKEDIEHSNVSFNENGTITAVPLHPLRYLPELSNGTEEDRLILPNIALLSITQVQSEASYFTRMGLNLLVRQTGAEPLVEMTAREFMFGYRSTLLTIGHKFLPSWISFDKLGLIDRMYDFDGDISTTFTGVNDVRRSGLLDTYNHQPVLPQWPYPCNNLTSASDGTKFPSLIQKNQELLFFRKSLCRSINLVKDGEAMIKGIHANRYVFKNHSMDNGEVDPTNKCFCLKKDRCMLPGLLDVNKCYYGFPIALSYPHFMDVDQRAFEKVEGLHPDAKKHTTYFMINEDSGLPLEVSVKMQINMVFGDLSGMAKVGRFSNMVLPMLWTDIVMPGLPSGMAWRFYFYLTVGPIVQALSTYLLLVGGVAFILLSLASAALIPKLSIVSSNRGKQRTQEPPILNPAYKRGPGGPAPSPNNKEMELYYCSLLAVQDQEC